MNTPEPNPPAQKTYEVSLTVNRYNKIIALSSNWEAVAAEGGAAETLASENVIGQELEAFIHSDTTRMYIESCLKLCRLKNEVLFRQYRCDSPTHKRFMELQLTPLKDGAVEMKHFLLKEAPFEVPIDIEEVAAESATHAPQYVRCSMCNRLKPFGSDKWMPPEDLHLTQRQSLKVIYSVCPDCLNAIWHKRSHAK